MGYEREKGLEREGKGIKVKRIGRNDLFPIHTVVGHSNKTNLGK